VDQQAKRRTKNNHTNNIQKNFIRPFLVLVLDSSDHHDLFLFRLIPWKEMAGVALQTDEIDPETLSPAGLQRKDRCLESSHSFRSCLVLPHATH
jgi:hypothetical protein